MIWARLSEKAFLKPHCTAIETERSDTFTHRMFTISLILAALALNSGCVTTSGTSATMAPGANIGNLKSFYVVQPSEDKHGIAKLISDNLANRGYTSYLGPALSQPPLGTDAVVTYSDTWMWGILIQLHVWFNNPIDNSKMARGSLDPKKSKNLLPIKPPGVVADVLTAIFNSATVVIDPRSIPDARSTEAVFLLCRDTDIQSGACSFEKGAVIAYDQNGRSGLSEGGFKQKIVGKNYSLTVTGFKPATSPIQYKSVNGQSVVEQYGSGKDTYLTTAGGYKYMITEGGYWSTPEY